MKFVPPAISRSIAKQALLAQKHSPEILFGAGVVSMVGSTVLACRATLKLNEVMNTVENDTELAHRAKAKYESGEVREGVTYTDDEMAQDLKIIKVQGLVKVAKLYAPPVILGAIGIACLTKSHKILTERNAALTAAYIAVDTAFKKYRERVIDRYGEELDRNIRYEGEEIDVVDEDTGKISSEFHVGIDEPSGYARWFDETCPSFNKPPQEIYNRIFLRNQQNWANDMLRHRGHLFLNEVYAMVGLPHTSAGAIVGWIYDRNNNRGDNYVDFGCWDKNGQFLDFFEGSNGREGAVLLDFNVDGPIWQLLDERNAQDTSR